MDGEPYDKRVEPRRPHQHRQHLRHRRAADRRRLARHALGPLQPHQHQQYRPPDPGGAAGSLDGDHGYGRFNPAAGVTFSPTRAVNLYAGYSEGSRAPTSIELGLRGSEPAVQAAQCAGRRSAARSGRHQNLGSRRPRRARHRSRGTPAYSSPTITTTSCSSRQHRRGFGYFKNFGSTRRQGFELAIERSARGRLSGGAGYTVARRDVPERRRPWMAPGNSSNDAAQAGQGPRRHDRDHARRPDSADSPTHVEGVRRCAGHVEAVGGRRPDGGVGRRSRAATRTICDQAGRHLLSRARHDARLRRSSTSARATRSTAACN